MAIATQTSAGWTVPDPAERNVLPGGGASGQVLAKRSPVDADVEWDDGPAAVIADYSIASAKLAQLPTKSYLGRTSSGTGPVEAVPVATLLADLGGLGGGGTTVINDLTTGGTTAALAAAQGVVLKGLVDTNATNIAAKPGLQSGALAASTTLAPNATGVVNAIATAVANLVASSPAALDTLNELAAALGNDANFAATIATTLGNKLSNANGAVGTLNLAARSIGAAQLAAAATKTYLGRTSAGSGDLEQVPVATMQADLGINLPAVALGTGSVTFTSAANAFRSNTWTGTVAGTATASGTLAEGDVFEFSNNGTANLTIAGATAPAGYTNILPPDVTGQWKYTGGVLKSLTPSPSAGSFTIAVVSGTGVVGATMTCTPATGWTGTFQWTSDGTNISGATSATYVVVSGDVGHAIGCKFTPTNYATNTVAGTAGASVTYAAAVLADSPLIYYKLGDAQGSTTVVDSSGNTRNGTLNNVSGAFPTAQQTGVFSGSQYAMTFAAANQNHIEYGTDVYGTGYTGSLTAECFFNLTSLPPASPESYSQFFGRGTGGGWSMYFIVGSDGTIYGSWVDSGGVQHKAQSAIGAVSAGTNYHAVVRIERVGGDTVTKVFLNGTLVATNTATGVVLALRDGDSGVLTVAGGPFSSAGTDDYKLDEVSFYNTALSDARIAAHYAARNT